jgi:hypothetical protein
MTTTATPRLAIATRIAREDLWQLRGIGNEFDVMAAVLEYGFRVRCLKVIDPYLGAWDVCGNSQNRYAAALAIEQAVDQMQVARTAAAGADRKASGEMGLCSRCESGSLFVPHVDPVNRLSPSQGVGKAVERVADNTINPLHAGLLKCFDKEFCRGPAHFGNLRYVIALWDRVVMVRQRFSSMS